VSPPRHAAGWNRRFHRASDHPTRRDGFTVHGLDRDDGARSAAPAATVGATAGVATAVRTEPDTDEVPVVARRWLTAPRGGRLVAWCVRHPWLDTAAVAAVVLAASLPYLLGVVVPGVFGYNSGLATVPIGFSMGHHVGLPWIDPNVGYVSQALGHRAAVDLLHGHLPWWNPFEGVGAPLAGEGQSAALFPLTLLLALPNGQLFFHLLLQLVAGMATQRLLREMGLSRPASMAGGMVFGLNGTFAWLTNAAFNPVAFLPVLLWGVERCRGRPFTEHRSGWVLVAVGLAGSVYTGFPETAYLDGLLVAAWAVLRWWQQGQGQRARYASTVGLGAAVGALVSAPFAAAFVAATRHADIGGHAADFATSHLPTAALDTVGLPYLYGPISGFSAQDTTGTLNAVWGNVGGYVTAALLCAALCGLLVGRDRKLRLLLGAWVVITWARSFGVGPVTSVLRLVPGIHSIAFGRYSPPSWELAIVVLAAMGIDAFARPGRALRRSRAALALAGVATGLLVAVVLYAGRHILHALSHTPGFAHFPTWALVWAAATVALLVAIGWLAPPKLARVGMGLVLVFDATAMFMVPQLSAPTTIPVDLAPVAYLQHHLGLSRFATLGPIVPNYGSLFGIAEVNAHDLPMPGKWAAYVAAHLEPNERPQQFDGVTSLDPAGPTPLVELRTHLADYEAIGTRYVVAPTAWGDIAGRRVFSDRDVSIFELPHPTAYFHTAAGRCALRAVSRTEVRADCTTPAVLVRQELEVPGWLATVNGRPAAVTARGPLFMQVALPAGRSTVTFTYRPPHTVPAGALALAGVLLAGALAVLPSWRRRQHRPRRSPSSSSRMSAGP
jgi:hypothetical protein